MKRYGNLYPQVTSFENLFLAAKKARKGKRFKKNVLEFDLNLESELLQLQAELTAKTYQPGQYQTFPIREPKPRIISAAPYRDRVVHHALCNIIVPIFEKSFIADSYANRVGFGTHKALKRFTQFARSNEYVLQCDIKKYFPSIDQEILKSLIIKKIKCKDTLWLIDKIIDNGNETIQIIEYFEGDDLLTPIQRKKGLPIGNLTSQFFANIYLNSLDHFVQEKLKISQYVRYVDDFALFAKNQSILAEARKEIENYLASLRLKIHPIKSQLFATKHGASFLGFRIFSSHLRIRSDNLCRGRKRLKKLQNDYRSGKINQENANNSLQSWFAHLDHGDTWQLKEQISASLTWLRD